MPSAVGLLVHLIAPGRENGFRNKPFSPNPLTSLTSNTAKNLKLNRSGACLLPVLPEPKLILIAFINEIKLFLKMTIRDTYYYPPAR